MSMASQVRPVPKGKLAARGHGLSQTALIVQVPGRRFLLEHSAARVSPSSWLSISLLAYLE
ncbi:MAG: hypothetical protein WCB64_04345 [Desulfobaccales bacterium]